DSAWKRLEDLTYRFAARSDSVIAYEQYLEEFPTGRHVEDAHAAIIRIAYLNAAGEDTIEAYEEFLREYYESRYASGVKSRLVYLRGQFEPQQTTPASARTGEADAVNE
ncbi:MAG: hypothetical protein MK538_06475, partial [Planctomycetes bacterium]|nr:hypothetical protein [Planctomycetota bacterium]